MKENKHIEKELLFKNNIKDITSISLDSDYKVEKNELIGNFLVSGEYKTHEISLNREKFNFKIPFKEIIKDDIDLETVSIEIINFIYDYKKDELLVNIDYEIIGDRKDVLIFDDKDSLDEFLKSHELEVIDTRLDEIKDDLEKKEFDKEEKIEVLNENESNIVEEIVPKKEVKETKEEKEEKFDLIEDRNMETKEIIDNMNNIEDGFVTYKVYKIKENETLESIVIKNKTTIDELKEYNDLNNLNINDKIIIPIYE